MYFAVLTHSINGLNLANLFPLLYISMVYTWIFSGKNRQAILIDRKINPVIKAINVENSVKPLIVN